jgi:hypothetical protein
MLGLAQCGFPKKRVRTRFTELVFLHPVGSAGHIVYSGASRSRNMDALFSMLRWDQCGYDKKRAGGICGSRSTF